MTRWIGVGLLAVALATAGGAMAQKKPAPLTDKDFTLDGPEDCGRIQRAADERDFAKRQAGLRACGNNVNCAQQVKDEFTQNKHENLGDNSLCQTGNKRAAARLTGDACADKHTQEGYDIWSIRTEASKKCRYDDSACERQAGEQYVEDKKKIDAAYSQCEQREKLLLKGKVDVGVRPVPTPRPTYSTSVSDIADAGKTVYRFSGRTLYDGVTISLSRVTPTVVGAEIEGDIKVISQPAKFGWAHGQLTSTENFRITELKDMRGNPVPLNGAIIDVPITSRTAR